MMRKKADSGDWEVDQIRHFNLDFELELKWVGMKLKFEVKLANLVTGNIVKFP